MDLTRRSVLRCGGCTLALGTLAGCLSEPGDGGDDEGGVESREGYAAFFALWDWAEQVGGDVFEFENPMEAGEMGHGWEPDADIAREIAGTKVFVYLDTPEFSWAQDIAAQLESDYDDVAVIDAMAELDDQLLAWDSGSPEDWEPDHDHEFDPDDLEIYDGGLINQRTGELAADWHDDHWHGGLPDIPLEGELSLAGAFEDDDGRVVPVGKDEQFQLDATVAEGAQEGLLSIESDGDSVRLSGEETGRTQLVFELRSDGEVVWDTSGDLVAAAVVEEPEEGGEEFADPHVWVDPVLATTIVDAIAEGLAEILPDDADTFEENAAAYNDRLAAVDERFEEVMSNAERTVGIFAGHDSFQYIEHRYGFELHSPVGVSPNDSPSQEDIAETIDLVEKHGIDTILYDPFETPDPDNDIPDLAETIVENSSASDVAPLTPAEGTTAEWNENEWGWIEQMEEVTIPSLAQALGAAE